MNKVYTIRKEGGSRIMTVSTIVPAKWSLVELEVLSNNSKAVTVKITKVR